MVGTLMRWAAALAVIVVAGAGRPVQAAPAPSCPACHENLGGRLASPVAGMADDVHARRGMSCDACHGGAPTRIGMDAHDRRAGYRGAPSPQQVPAFCARCHSRPDIIRRYNPRLPTDQLDRYWTSVHGQRLRRGDTQVATCTSCHGVHPVRAVDDTRSPVFPTNVPATCAICHADAARMKPYGIPTTQYEEYRASVHGQALLERGNRRAPACNDCHDNHGAVPPGATSVANVCAQCHSATRDLFVRSPHKSAFDALGLAECTVCHGTHNIAFPTDEMLGTGPGSVCAPCHPPGSPEGAVADSIRASLEQLKALIAQSEAMLARASRAGLDVTDAQLDISEAETQVIRARAVTHTSSPEQLRSPIDAGTAAAERARRAGEAALAELAFRRRGLAVSLGVMAVVVVSLWLKLRQLERASGRSGKGAPR
ncbi:MAG: cytochrome c3 family protein [Armatimonadota bacterium]|nr:cytochrome c3 family protein [Armatimonadota bacterium]MDR7403383.1 cytochrome c3 family protein [Armatimonadota bacterium]